MSSPVSVSNNDLLRSSIICCDNNSCSVVTNPVNAEECEPIDVDGIITEVYKELPPGKYHESERLWKILYLLQVVDDSEVPEFVTSLATAPSPGDTSSSSSSDSTPEPENGFSSFIKGFQTVLSDINNFTDTEEGKNLLSSLPGGLGDNIVGAVKDLNDESGENPFSKILGVFTSK